VPKDQLDMPSNLLKMTITIWTVTYMLAMQSCTPTILEPTAINASPSHLSPAMGNAMQTPTVTPMLFAGTFQCTEETMPPIIADVQPPLAVPGGEISVIGTGGYIQDSCGGFNESARMFKLYLDNESAGELLCYVNHCEVQIDLADTIASGLHCLSTQKDICEFEFQVVPK